MHVHTNMQPHMSTPSRPTGEVVLVAVRAEPQSECLFGSLCGSLYAAPARPCHQREDEKRLPVDQEGGSEKTGERKRGK